MKKIEISIPKGDCPQEYQDLLILGLVYCGFAPYLGWDNSVCFTGDAEELVTYTEEDEC